jgi:ribonuclease HI
MQAIGPHYFLFADSFGRPCHARQWRFVLQPTCAGERIVAADVERDADGMRLNLLAVVRGLEALDQPSRVTLLVTNRFVRRGIRHDLCQWRERNWRWERFGSLVPIRDQDLWQRVDRALGIHQVDCLAWPADEQVAWTCRVNDPSIVERRVTCRSYPARRCAGRVGRRLTHWGQEVLQSLSGLGQPALSRTA